MQPVAGLFFDGGTGTYTTGVFKEKMWLSCLYISAVYNGSKQLCRRGLLAGYRESGVPSPRLSEDDVLALGPISRQGWKECLSFQAVLRCRCGEKGEREHVLHFSLRSVRLLGIVIAAVDMDAATAALDADTREPAGSRFNLLRFIYYVVNLNTGLMASMSRRFACHAGACLPC